jgi:hypothetical protein
LMTAVNSDVGATFAFTLFLWGAVQLIRQGFTVWRLLWVLGSAALCVGMKNTAAPAVPLTLLAVWLTWVPKRRWITWALIGAGLLLIAAVTFAWGDAALWYRGAGNVQQHPTRIRTEAAPLGEHAIAVTVTPDQPDRQVVQFLLNEDVKQLRGQEVTVGSWMWSDRSVKVRSPMLCDTNRHCEWEPTELTRDPSYRTITGTISSEADRIEIRLKPHLQGLDSSTAVYYDGVVLVDGIHEGVSPPTFESDQARKGSWVGNNFRNRIRNGSGERAWIYVRSWAETELGRFFPWPYSPSLFLSSVLDWPRTSWAYQIVGINLLETFWARLAWGHVSIDETWYWVLGAATLIGLGGSILILGKWWSAYPVRRKRSVLYVIFVGIVVWVNALMRFHPIRGEIFLPVSRYAYPAIFPIALAIVAGWLGVGKRRRWVLILMISLLVVVDVVALIRVLEFYHR